MDPADEDLHNAADTNNIEEVKRALALGANPSIALIPAAEFNYLEILAYLISRYQFDEDDLSAAFTAAASNGSIEAVKIFYKLEVIPDHVGNALTRAIRNGYLDVVMFLVANGATGEVVSGRHPQITEFLADYRETSPQNTDVESLLMSVTSSASSRLIANYY